MSFNSSLLRLIADIDDLLEAEWNQVKALPPRSESDVLDAALEVDAMNKINHLTESQNHLKALVLVGTLGLRQTQDGKN